MRNNLKAAAIILIATAILWLALEGIAWLVVRPALPPFWQVAVTVALWSCFASIANYLAGKLNS